eukprot:4885220-Amphidinium_carterae.1
MSWLVGIQGSTETALATSRCSDRAVLSDNNASAFRPDEGGRARKLTTDHTVHPHFARSCPPL